MDRYPEDGSGTFRSSSGNNRFLCLDFAVERRPSAKRWTALTASGKHLVAGSENSKEKNKKAEADRGAWARPAGASECRPKKGGRKNLKESDKYALTNVLWSVFNASASLRRCGKTFRSPEVTSRWAEIPGLA